MSKRKFIAPFRVIGKGIWRDLINIKKYKMRLLSWIIDMFIILVSTYFFGIMIDFNPLTASETGLLISQVFIFRASGFALSTFSDVAVWSPMGRVEQDIHYGTLEAIFVSPANRISYLLSTTFSEAIINMIFFVPAYLIILGMAGVLGNIVVVGTTLLVVLLTMISMMGFGVFFAMLAILVRRAHPIAVIINNIFRFICGAYVPVQTFLGWNIAGKILKNIAQLFPYTYCYDLFRYYIFGASYNLLFPIWLEYLLLFVTTVFFVSLAFLLLKVVERKAKVKGLSIL